MSTVSFNIFSWHLLLFRYPSYEFSLYDYKFRLSHGLTNERDSVTLLNLPNPSAQPNLNISLLTHKRYLQRAALGQLDGIRTKDFPRIDSALQTIKSDVIPQMTRTIMASISTEAQNTRATVSESGWVTTTEIENLQTALGQMLLSHGANMEERLLSPIKQHMDGATEMSMRELRALCQQLTSTTTAASSSAGSESTAVQPADSSVRSPPSGRRRDTKPTTTVRWERTLPLVLGSFVVRGESRQRILIRVRKYKSEKDTSIDTETTYTIGFKPNPWLFGNWLTGCNWKFSVRTTRRVEDDHPVWDAIENGDIEAIIGYFQNGSLSINDVREMNGGSLLHHATMMYHYEVCEWLVDNGVDVHISDDLLQTAIYGLKQDISPDYNPLMNLLIERCGLDPNDKNLHGLSVMEKGFASSGHNGFARLLRLSLPLCTEPEGDRIKDLFHSITRTGGGSAITRLKYLLDEYKRSGLPEEDTQGRKWWYTADFLWKFANLFQRDIYLGLANDQNPEAGEEWVEEQVCGMIRSGVDLHSTHEQQTLLNYLLEKDFDPTNTKHKANYYTEADYNDANYSQLIYWLQLLHIAGGARILTSYLRKEQSLHPGGELIEARWHNYLEHPVFTVEYSEATNSITITAGQVVLDPTTALQIPGAWNSNAEVAFCDERGLKLDFRVLRANERPTMMERWERVVARYEDPSSAEPDPTICDWELTDGRIGNMYPIYTISTAGFDQGDYSDETGIVFARDHAKYPVRIQYPNGWVRLGPAWDPERCMEESLDVDDPGDEPDW